MRSKNNKQDTKELERSLREAARQNSSGRDALADEFVRRAEREGLLDVAYTEFDSPVGQLLLATTPRGLVRVTFPVEATEKVLEELAASVSPRVLESPAKLDECAAHWTSTSRGACATSTSPSTGS